MPQHRTSSRVEQQSDRRTISSPLRDIRFTGQLNPELFSQIAEQAAQRVAQNRASNKPTQLRRFYDEIILWETRVNQNPEKFPEYLPFIKMLNAKVAYAKGRKLVDDHFVDLIQHTLNEIKADNPKTLTTCKLFWEAFMGFYKKERPSDN